MKYLFLITVLFCLFSCKTKEHFPKETNEVASLSFQEELPVEQIAFLNFTIEKDSLQNKNSMLLNSKMIVSGSMRDDKKRTIGSQSYLTIRLYEEDQLKDEFYAEHPLYSRVEYVNDNGQFETQTIYLNIADFFIRIPLKRDNTGITISETLFDSIENQLLTINNISK
jgi:hypothetical protein